MTGSRPMRRASERRRVKTRSPANAAKRPGRCRARRWRSTASARLRQHAGHRRRHDISEPQRRAEHARAVEHARRGKFAQPRRQCVVHDQPDVAIEHGERQISAAGMIDGGEAAVGDDVERLLAAVIGMRPPADVGEQARGMTQAAFVGGLIEARRSHETVGPFDQLFAMARRARAQLIETARGLDECVLLLVLLLEQRIEQPFAHPERGKYHLARSADAQNMFEHQRRIGEQRPPRTGDHFDLGKRLDVDAMQQAGEFQRLVGGNGVAVHHVQRIAGLPHVQPRQRPPGAADGVEAAVLATP